MIHETALVDPSAVLGTGVRIGPFSRIGPGVALSDNVSVGAYTEITPRRECGPVYLGNGTSVGSSTSIRGTVNLESGVIIGDRVTLVGPLRVGNNSQIFEGAIIGNPPQFPGHHASGGEVLIGRHVTIREGVFINQPHFSKATVVGDSAYIMSQSQIDHDCRIGTAVKFASGVTLGGSVQVDERAYLGMSCVIHQGLRIGGYAMVGMNGSIMKNVPPFATVIDHAFTKINARGLELAGATTVDIQSINDWYVKFHNQGFRAGTTDCDGAWLTVLDAYFREVDAKTTYRPSFIV